MFGSQQDVQAKRKALSRKIANLKNITLDTLLASLIVLPGMFGDMQRENTAALEVWKRPQKRPQTTTAIEKKAAIM